MGVNFKCSNALSVSLETLKDSIFHIRVAPYFYADKISASDKYGYLADVPEDKTAEVEQNEDILKIKTADASFIFDRKICCLH